MNDLAHLPPPDERIPHGRRVLIIAAALLALFLGALDALVMSAAMPTVVSELGGLGLFSWVYSGYMLARAVSLPIFGKLADLLPTRALYQAAIGIFVAGSLAAGFAPSMEVLIACRALQGIGAGGSFALVYVVLTDVSSPETRAKSLSLGSFIWGLASVLGPSLGALIVSELSWRWIFLINVPLGLLSMGGIATCLVETRRKRASATIDYAGAAALSTCVVSLLLLCLIAGELHDWGSPHIAALALVCLLSGYLFCRVEDRAADPILPLPFFTVRGFSTGNAAVFLSSVAVFALFAYAPLFVQSALGRPPMEVGTTVLALSLGWSIGSLVLGRTVNRIGTRGASILGAVMLSAGCAATLSFSTATSLGACFSVFLLIGTGMGFVALGTILVVQNSLSDMDLGVATASNQFARSLGGTVGVGAAGGFFASRFDTELHALLEATPAAAWPAGLAAQLQRSPDPLFRPDTQRLLAPELLERLHAAVASGVLSVFAMVLAAALLCLIICLLLPATPPDPAAHRR